MNKTELLKELYQEETHPVWILGAEKQILWLNQAAAEKFPSVLEEMALEKAFPEINFGGLTSLSSGAPAVSLYTQNKTNQFSVQCFEDSERIYVVIWSENLRYQMGEKTESGDEIFLLDAWLRQRIHRIFSNLDQINLILERNNIVEGISSTERIERNCQQLLRLGYNLSGYYGSAEEMGSLPQVVDITAYLKEIFREVEFYLIPAEITLSCVIRSEGAFCKVDVRRFSAALINLIDLSAAYAPKKGKIKISLSKTRTEFCLEVSDKHTPSDILKQAEDAAADLLPRGRSNLQLPRISLGFLNRVIQECGGRWMMDAAKGIHVMIRIPLEQKNIPVQVEDVPAYTVCYRGQNRTSLVSILLSDLDEPQK